METKTSKEDEPKIQVLNQIEDDKIFEPSLLSKEDAEYASKASQMFTLPELASKDKPKYKKPKLLWSVETKSNLCDDCSLELHRRGPP